MRSGASLPPLYHTGPPSLAVSPGRATAYPVTWPGFFALNRWRASTPARSRRAKNSCSLRAPAAAVVTWRRSVMRGGSSRPRRAAFGGLGAGGTAGRGPVGGRGGLQPVAFLGGQARRPHVAPLVGQADTAAVLAGQHRHDVDVVVAVPDRDPPDGVVFLPVGGTARCGSSRRGRSAPTRRRTVPCPGGRRASTGATPGGGTRTCPWRRAAGSAGRSVSGSPACRRGAAAAPARRDAATRSRCAGRYVPRGGRGRTGSR